MFNNANVIFRTKFVDGVSTVARTIGTGSSRVATHTFSDTNASESTAASTDKGRSRATKKGKENAVR